MPELPALTVFSFGVCEQEAHAASQAAELQCLEACIAAAQAALGPLQAHVMSLQSHRDNLHQEVAAETQVVLDTILSVPVVGEKILSTILCRRGCTARKRRLQQRTLACSDLPKSTR